MKEDTRTHPYTRLDDCKNVWSQLRTKVFHLRAELRAGRATVKFHWENYTAGGAAGMWNIRVCVSRISLIELRGGHTSVWHLTCKLKHLTLACTWQQRDNCAHAYAPARSHAETFGTVSGKRIDHILAFICRLRLRTDVFNVVRSAIRDLDGNNDDGEKMGKDTGKELPKERQRRKDK